MGKQNVTKKAQDPYFTRPAIMACGIAVSS